MAIRERREAADPETIAIRALAFLAADEDRLSRFLALTGTRADGIRQAAADPGFLLGVLNHVVGWEPLLLEFAGAEKLDPAEIALAARRLEGGVD